MLLGDTTHRYIKEGWVPSHPDTTFGIELKIIDPMLARKDIVGNACNVGFFYFCFQQANEADFILVQEDFEFLLFIWLIKATDVLTTDSIHGGAVRGCSGSGSM